MLKEENSRLQQELRIYQRREQEEAARRRKIEQNLRQVDESLRQTPQSQLNPFDIPHRQERIGEAIGVDSELQFSEEREQSDRLQRQQSIDRLSDMDFGESERDSRVKRKRIW